MGVGTKYNVGWSLQKNVKWEKVCNVFFDDDDDAIFNTQSYSSFLKYGIVSE